MHQQDTPMPAPRDSRGAYVHHLLPTAMAVGSGWYEMDEPDSSSAFAAASTRHSVPEPA